MPVRINEAVRDIRAATADNGSLILQYDQSADGLGFEVRNWSKLWPVLESLLDQSWFPDKEWVEDLVGPNREQPVLKLSQDRITQLQHVISEISTRLPVILEAWQAVVHEQSDKAFHVNAQLQTLSDLGELAERLDDIFKLLAVDNAFSIMVSEGFILVVPEGAYSHLCATFALYLATKSLQLTQGPTGASYKEVIRFLPEYEGSDRDKEDAIEEAIQKWAAQELAPDWEWFEETRKQHFADSPNTLNARANIEKALPLISGLLREGKCHIDPPALMPEQTTTEELQTKYRQVRRATMKVAQAIKTGNEIIQTALQIAQPIQDLSKIVE